MMKTTPATHGTRTQSATKPAPRCAMGSTLSIKTHIKAGAPPQAMNHNQVRRVRIRTAVKSGALNPNHNQVLV